MSYDATSKKTRWIGRRIRAIEKWRSDNSILNLDSITVAHSKHLSFHKEIFSELLLEGTEIITVNQQRKIKNLIVKSMIDIYNEWDKYLKEEYDEYYLKLWIYPHSFLDSQIVIAVNDKIQFYKGLFELEIENKDIDLDLKSIENFKWEKYMDHVVISESKYLGYEKDLEVIKSKSFKVKEEETCGEVEKYFYIPKGTIWVGEKIS